MEREKRKPTNHKYTKELLAPIVASCKSWREVCDALGIRSFSGSQGYVTRVARSLGIDDGHFTGRHWRRGRTFPKKRRIDEYLVAGSVVSSAKLRERLIQEGLKAAKCEACDLTTWLGQPAPLELDHINSDHTDNRLGNLQILCPNCHAVKTAKTRNGGRKSSFKFGGSTKG